MSPLHHQGSAHRRAAPVSPDAHAAEWRRMQKRVCVLQRRIDNALQERHWTHLRSLKRAMRRLVSANALALTQVLEQARHR